VPRFLHTADWQIGRQYATFAADDAVPLAEARIATVERLASLATEHAVDAVLVAGDVFDAQTVSERTIRRLFNALAGFAGPWLMIPGNHDAALAESVWTRAARLQALPGNLHLALEPATLDFARAGFTAFMAPLVQRHTSDDRTIWFDSAPSPEGHVRIGIAHGSVQGLLAEGIDSLNPIAPDRASRARLDYLALGDWHGCKQIDARTWYSGTPEPDRFRGNEPGHALLVEIDAPGVEPRVRRLPVGQFRWSSLEQTLAVASDIDALCNRLGTLEAADVWDLRLAGTTDLAGLQRLRRAIAAAEARARSLQADFSALRLAPTPEDIAALQADGYLGEVIEDLRERQSRDADIAPEASDEAARQARHAASTAREALALLADFLAEQRQIAAGSLA
jgi:DNA repair exonuclease SbcCD nuclease subunit